MPTKQNIWLLIKDSIQVEMEVLPYTYIINSNVVQVPLASTLISHHAATAKMSTAVVVVVFT